MTSQEEAQACSDNGDDDDSYDEALHPVAKSNQVSYISVGVRPIMVESNKHAEIWVTGPAKRELLSATYPGRKEESLPEFPVLIVV